jgi:hypothetical protein
VKGGRLFGFFGFLAVVVTGVEMLADLAGEPGDSAAALGGGGVVWDGT